MQQKSQLDLLDGNLLSVTVFFRFFFFGMAFRLDKIRISGKHVFYQCPFNSFCSVKGLLLEMYVEITNCSSVVWSTTLWHQILIQDHRRTHHLSRSKRLVIVNNI